MRWALAGLILSAAVLLAGCTATVPTGGTIPGGTIPGGTIPNATDTAAPEIDETPDISETPEITGTAESPVTGSETTDPALIGITWQWVRTEQPDGSFVETLDPSRYTLTFMADGTLAVLLDCNSGGGTYIQEGSNLSFGPIASTRMACPEGSQANVFAQDLENVASYVIDGSQLVLSLAGGGTMFFSPPE